MELADTSAWFVSKRDDGAAAAQAIEHAIERDRLATSDMVRFELLLTARDADEFSWLAEYLDELTDCPIGKPQWERALWVYGRLAEQGGAHQRSVGYADLLIAAAAETAEATILHYDEDYDRIAAITGQPARWILPRGSL